jgi:beta-mannosidase
MPPPVAPREAEWFAVPVPGTMQQALVEQHRVPDPFIGTNEGAIQWAGLAAWDMRRTLDVTPAMLAHRHLDLVFDGIDTFATVSVNGQVVLKGRQRPSHLARAGARPAPCRRQRCAGALRLADRALQPMVLKQAHPLPGEYDSAFGDEPKGVQTSPISASPYQYGWDWGPRIVNIGLARRAAGRLGRARIGGLDVQQDALTAQSAVTARPGGGGRCRRAVDRGSGRDRARWHCAAARPAHGRPRSGHGHGDRADQHSRAAALVAGGPGRAAAL